MKKTTIGQLKKDQAEFKFNKRSKVIWVLQKKYTHDGDKYATITAKVSGRTTDVFTSRDCYIFV